MLSVTRIVAALLLLMAATGCAIFGGGDKWDPRYEVETGDTLYSIAKDNGIPLRDLAAWNRIPPPYTIHVGQTLRLNEPEDFDYDLSGPPETPPPTSTPPAVPPPVASVSTAPASTPSTPGAAPSQPPATATPPTQTAMAAPIRGSVKWRWPVLGELARVYQPEAGSSGIDIVGTPGQPVRAAAGGKVVYGGGGLQGYGMLIIVKHGENFLSAYGYNRKLLVQQGDEVHAGQPIAEMGEGPQRRPMLHFEIRRSGKTIDPLLVLPAR